MLNRVLPGKEVPIDEIKAAAKAGSHLHYYERKIQDCGRGLLMKAVLSQESQGSQKKCTLAFSF